MPKFLIVREDRLVPSWPVFVLDGYHPCAHIAMNKYAQAIRQQQLPGVDEAFAMQRRMETFAGQCPPAIITPDPYVVEAIRHPGCYVKLYELERGHR